MAQAIPTYMKSIFKVPEGLIDEIYSLLCKFWWGSREDMRKLHWKNLDKLCLPKAKGGMIRDLKCFNHALLVKQLCRLHTNESTLLHKILKAKYFKNSSVTEANRGFDPSFSWRSMWGAKGLLCDGLVWRVENGSNIDIWADTWLLVEGKVSESMYEDRSGWDASMISSVMGPEWCTAVLTIPLPTVPCADKRY
ncbi:uncharacterized protein LOC110698241 [Chenopodium quinoa]|uniref:uncharacterized protein LOC110698241 n=1 Tax=Chenopodium quinoa TaxID=63459 RepID=UPI000B77FAF4|nr:uncharacterized protein LOC110698241 [Chenopodium quinoa]